MDGRVNFNGCVFVRRLVDLKERGQKFAVIVRDRPEGRPVEVCWDLEVWNHPLLDLWPWFAGWLMVKSLCVALSDRLCRGI